MKRLWLILCVLPVFLGLGCAADSEWNRGWAAAWKDAQGENMKMRTSFPDGNRPNGSSGQMLARD